MFQEGMEKRFCKENFLTSATFEIVYGIRSQLLGQLRASGFVNMKPPGDLRELNQNSDNWCMVKAVLTSMLHPKICSYDANKNTIYDK